MSVSPERAQERTPLLSPILQTGSHLEHLNPSSTHSASKPSSHLKPSLPFYHVTYRKFPSRPRTLLFMISILLSATAVYVYNSSTQQDLIDNLANSIENLSTCASCKALLIPLISIAHLGDEYFYSTLVAFCVGLGIQDAEVCQGALDAQAPIIAHSLRSMSIKSHTANLFCAKTFGLCEDPPVREWVDMPLPDPKRLPVSNSKSGLRHQPTGEHPRTRKRDPFQVVHISDLHIDREYTIGADASCGRNLCCRLNQPTDTPNRTITPAGPYGNHKCDSPPSLYVSMLRAMQDHARQAAFVVNTGDMVDHAVWNSVRKEVEEGVEQGHSQYHSYSAVPLYGVIGNHDVAPTNSFPRNTTITTLSSQWDLELFSNIWEPWIGKEGAKTVAMMSGCYSRIHPGTNLRIISLNTGFWYKANFWLYDSDEFQPDPNGIFAWLIGELQEAENRGQKAWLMGHLSPGKADCLHEPSRYLNRIMRRYKDTIAASLYGHTHRSEWEIVYEDPRNPTADTAIGITFIGPAMTPESGNPAFRVYDVDPSSYKILDFHEIITDLSEPGYQSHPRWFEYYSARSTYGKMLTENGMIGLLDDHQPLDGSFWHRVTDVLETSYPEFEKFYGRMTRGADLAEMGDWRPCFSGECRKKWVHNLRSSQSEFNGYPNHLGLNIDSVGDDNSHIDNNYGRMGAEEEDGEHVCGDLASLYRSARRRRAHLKGEKQIKIPKGLRKEIRKRIGRV